MSSVRDLIITALEEASRPYLLDNLAQIPSAQHPTVIAQVKSYRQLLADICLNGYAGTGLLTTDFIRTLHQSLFPPGFKQELKSFDSDQYWMVPGQYKTSHNARESVSQSEKLILFLPPDQVPVAMEKIVASLNSTLAAASGDAEKTDVIFLFLFNFLAIHPFPDANGRVACILADLLAIHAGLPPFHLHRFKGLNQSAFYHAIEVAQREKNMTLAREIFEKYRNQ